MGVMTIIGGVPLYTSAQEAIAWAQANGLSGYHTHSFQGQLGYMGGASHAAATQGSTMPKTTTTTGGY